MGLTAVALGHDLKREIITVIHTCRRHIIKKIILALKAPRKNASENVVC